MGRVRFFTKFWMCFFYASSNILLPFLSFYIGSLQVLVFWMVLPLKVFSFYLIIFLSQTEKSWLTGLGLLYMRPRWLIIMLIPTLSSFFHLRLFIFIIHISLLIFTLDEKLFLYSFKYLEDYFCLLELIHNS